MTDIVDAATRSRMMSGIKGSHTKPELIVRKYLHSKGFRFRLHRKELPGRPDLVLPKHKLVIFVHGCFWHCHFNCFYSRIPKTRVEFWTEKLSKNVARDATQIERLVETGWRVLVIWECGINLAKGEFSDIERLIVGHASIAHWPTEPFRKA